MFKSEGCENCEDLLSMRGSTERVLDCTTTTFTGFVAVSSPSESWTATWLRVDRGTRGIYAMRVGGPGFPEEVVEMLNEKGIKYPPDE